MLCTVLQPFRLPSGERAAAGTEIDIPNGMVAALVRAGWVEATEAAASEAVDAEPAVAPVKRRRRKAAAHGHPARPQLDATSVRRPG